ncbi:MAG: hypothetical protein ACLT1K_11820 [[Clostridium] leptum]
MYKTHKNKLIHTDWSKYNGNVVHYPEKIAPDDLQRENYYRQQKNLLSKAADSGGDASPRLGAAVVYRRVLLAEKRAERVKKGAAPLEAGR